MNLHIMPDDKFVDEFIGLSETSSGKGRNVYLVNANLPLKYVRANVPVASYGSPQFYKIIGDLARYERVFIHFLGDDMCQFINQADNRVRFFWVFWGADLYSYIDYPLYGTKTKALVRKLGIPIPRRERYLRFFPRETERSKSIKKISHILHYDKSEYDLIVQHFPTGAKYAFFFYPNRITWADMLQDPIPNNSLREKMGISRDDKMILLGNSGWPTNNHLEIMHHFAQRVRFPFKLVVPLSYGHSAYITALVNEGRKILGDRFIPLLEFLSPSQYGQILQSCDLAVFNSHRTQGVGNITALLFMGKRVFLNPKASFYDFLRRNGIYADSVKELGEFAGNRAAPGVLLRNRERLSNVFSEERLRRVIEEIYRL